MAERKQKSGKPIGEWIAGAIGLLLTLAILGYIGWQAVQAPERVPPMIAVEVKSLSRSGSGFLVEISARNRSPRTAAQVEVEGTLKRGGSDVATSSTTLAYLPGHSERHGGLYFDQDPRQYQLQVRALGYARP